MTQRRDSIAKPAKPELFCSYCGKSPYQVTRLIAGAKLFICDECIRRFSAVAEDGRAGRLMSYRLEIGAADEMAAMHLLLPLAEILIAKPLALMARLVLGERHLQFVIPDGRSRAKEIREALQRYARLIRGDVDARQMFTDDRAMRDWVQRLEFAADELVPGDSDSPADADLMTEKLRQFRDFQSRLAVALEQSLNG